MFVFVLFVTHMIFYWSAALFYVVVHQQKSQHSSTLIRNVLTNQIVFTSVYAIPFHFYPTPYSYWNIFWQLPCILLLTDFIFYTTHRYFHYNKYLYRNIHLKHHQMDDPVYAPGALNAHPLEHICINLFSTVAPLFIVKASLPVAVVWTIIASVNVTIAHSATWKFDPHTIHHKYKAYNYGAGPLLLDRLFGSFKVTE